MNIPIVVSAYDRAEALARILSSLSRAEYKSGPVRLIISIDGKGSPEVEKVARSFSWPFGELEVICHKENLGLRDHILFCGALTKNYDGIILLEDDLYVSPAFYQYAQQAAKYYRDCDDVSGIALYAPSFNENAYLPFYPLHDGNDVYFMQLACSWGQLWLKEHWQEFADWYGKNKVVDLSEDASIPHGVRLWPDTSWKKFFIKFLVDRDKYFVYPRSSYTTNFGDKGKHHTGTGLFQVPLLQGELKEVSFVEFDRSYVKYDAYGEIIPESLSRLCPHLEGMDLVVDLYGIKEEHCYTKEYVLTSKKCAQYSFSFCRCMLPIEYNIIDNIQGDDIFITRPGDIFEIDGQDYCRYIYSKAANIEEILYFYNISMNHYASFQNEINSCKDKNIFLNKKNKELKGYLNQKQNRINKIEGDLEEVQNKYKFALESIDLIRNSHSYRLGNKIISPINYIRKLINK